MSKYGDKEFRLGDYWLGRREGSPAYYRYWLDGRVVRRASLGTTELEVAKRKLEEWFIKTREVRDEQPSSASLADIIRRNWEEHARHLPSASGNRAALDCWLEYWGTATVSELTIPRQELFHQQMRAKGHKNSTIARTINIGQAALSRAVKRGELLGMPYIAKVRAEIGEPKGRPLELDELRRLYAASAPHVQAFIRWGLGTAARPAALLDLTSDQIDWSRGVVQLNPLGRQQNKKHRATVRLPSSLAERFDGFLVQVGGERVRSIRTAWRASVRRAGIPGNVTGYSLRHTAARWMRLQGVPVDEVKQQLGHRTEGVTGLYTAYDPRYLDQACAALDRLVQTSCKPVGGAEIP